MARAIILYIKKCKPVAQLLFFFPPSKIIAFILLGLRNSWQMFDALNLPVPLLSQEKATKNELKQERRLVFEFLRPANAACGLESSCEQCVFRVRYCVELCFALQALGCVWCCAPF